LSAGHRNEAADTLDAAALSEGPKGHVMRRFVAGLLLGLASMYWYAYQKDAFVEAASDWFAEASSDPDAKAKIDKMTARKR
jgi:hypothetical protein